MMTTRTMLVAAAVSAVMGVGAAVAFGCGRGGTGRGGGFFGNLLSRTVAKPTLILAKAQKSVTGCSLMLLRPCLPTCPLREVPSGNS